MTNDVSDITGLPTLDNPNQFWRVVKDKAPWNPQYYFKNTLNVDFQSLFYNKIEQTYSVALMEKVIQPGFPEEGHWEYEGLGFFSPKKHIWVVDKLKVPEKIFEYKHDYQTLLKIFFTKEEFIEEFGNDQWLILSDRYINLTKNKEQTLEDFLSQPKNVLYKILPLTGENILWAAQRTLETRNMKEEIKKAREAKEAALREVESKFLGDYPPKGLNNVKPE